jgi:hypothetical protein
MILTYTFEQGYFNFTALYIHYQMLIPVYCLLKYYMVFYKNKNRLNLSKWVKIFLILDIVIYILLLLIFPNLWFIGYNFVLFIIGTIVSYLIYEKRLKYEENNWRKLAEILVTVNVSLNAIFCIIITSAIIIGVLHAVRA